MVHMCMSLFDTLKRIGSVHDDVEICYRLLSSRLLGQGYLKERLILTFKRFYGRYHELVTAYDKSPGQMISNGFNIICAMWKVSS